MTDGAENIAPSYVASSSCSQRPSTAASSLFPTVAAPHAFSGRLPLIHPAAGS